ncbi:MAG: Crp/Fnr family transcriptional regulator [Bacteroidia bacterium]|nr:Crp/Fnr family transcriptional regulator [Bacteroidia bacterium]
MSGLFASYMRDKFSLSEEELEAVSRRLRPVSLRRGEHLLREGEICTWSAFVTDGAMVYYQLIEGEEHVCDFAFETDWVSQIKSFTQQAPAEMSIKAMEPCELLVLSRDHMTELLREQPRLYEIRAQLAEESFLLMNERNLSQTTLRAEDRYLRLMQTRPEVIRRAPQYYIASYLGILPQSLSRIRKKL